jgi:histidine ammonia-lyase
MQEDHVSMGWNAARKLRRSVDGLTRVVAIELMTAARGLELRTTTGDTAGTTPARATGAVVRLLREHGVGAPGPDRFLSPEIETAVELVASGAVLSAVESEIGDLL